MKKLLLICLTLLMISISAICFGKNISIVNSSGHDVYIYDWDMSLKPAVTIAPITGGSPLVSGTSVDLTLQEAANPTIAGRRIYFSDKELNKSLARIAGGGLLPAMPDAFTPWYDGGVMFSFAEYLYQPAKTPINTYTIDLSYLDVFSYPITVKFTGTTYAGFQENFEYGFTSFSKVVSELKKQTTYSWDNLVWPKDSPVSPGYKHWPSGIYRILGPNKVWTAESFGGFSSGYAPTPYQNFVKALPYNGTQLFNVKNKTQYTNFNGWLYSLTQPQNTGYAKALHNAATADDSGRFGFFTYCNDETSGQFTYVPAKAKCILTIYPYDT